MAKSFRRRYCCDTQGTVHSTQTSSKPAKSYLHHQALFASQILYVIAIGFTRISTSFFTGRFLTRDQRNMKLAHGFTIAFGVWTVASIFIVALRGQLSTPWDTLDGAQTLFIRWLAIEAIGTIIDVSTFALCVYFIWGLQMPIGKRLIVSAIFFGRLACARHPRPFYSSTN
jgi:hypothetical protein